MEKIYFLERKSRVNRLLSEALGASASPYLICASGRRPNTRYGLALTAQQIEYRPRTTKGSE